MQLLLRRLLLLFSCLVWLAIVAIFIVVIITTLQLSIILIYSTVNTSFWSTNPNTTFSTTYICVHVFFSSVFVCELDQLLSNFNVCVDGLLHGSSITNIRLSSSVVMKMAPLATPEAAPLVVVINGSSKAQLSQLAMWVRMWRGHVGKRLDFRFQEEATILSTETVVFMRLLEIILKVINICLFYAYINSHPRYITNVT